MDNKELISNKQGIALIVLFLNGEASIFIEGISAKNDLWLSIIIAAFCALPVILMFARLHALFPGRNLYDIIEICLGKYLGKILVLIFTWYCFHSISITLEDFGFFIRTNIYPDTPCYAIIIPFIVVCVYAVKHGIEVLGRWAELFMFVPIVLVLLVFLLLLPKMDFANLTPVLYDGFKPVVKGSFLTFIFPFTYIVVFTMVCPLSNKKDSPYKIYLFGFLIGASIMTVIYMTVMLVLGSFNAATIYYPTYVVVALINIGNFLQRLDIIAAVVYLTGIFIQTSVFLLGACNGFAKLFAFRDYRFIVWPVAIMTFNLCAYELKSVMGYFEFGIETWPYYILPYEVILPLIIWVIAEFRVRSAKKRGISL